MRVLVTGATGFIGLHLVPRLLQLGHAVRTLIRHNTRSHPARVQALEDQGAEIVFGDLANRASIEKAVRSVDSVCHLALSYNKRTRLHRSLICTNLQHTDNLLRATVRAGVPRVVLSGSVAVYGWPQLVPYLWPLAEDSPTLGVGIYPQLKLQTEALVRSYQPQGLDYVILRLPNVYGPRISRFERVIRQVLLHPVHSLSQNCAMGVALECCRYSHWIQVRDAAESIALAATLKGRFADVYNVAGENAIPRVRLVALIHRIARSGQFRASLGSLSARLRPVRIYDIQRAKQYLGFEPKISLQQGLSEIISAMTPRRPGVRAFTH